MSPASGPRLRRRLGIAAAGPATVYGPVAQLGARTGQLYAPAWGPVTHAVPMRFASLLEKLHTVICLVR